MVAVLELVWRLVYNTDLRACCKLMATGLCRGDKEKGQFRTTNPDTDQDPGLGLQLDSKVGTYRYHCNFEGDWEQRYSKSFQVGCNLLDQHSQAKYKHRAAAAV